MRALVLEAAHEEPRQERQSAACLSESGARPGYCRFLKTAAFGHFAIEDAKAQADACLLDIFVLGAMPISTYCRCATSSAEPSRRASAPPRRDHPQPRPLLVPRSAAKKNRSTTASPSPVGPDHLARHLADLDFSEAEIEHGGVRYRRRSFLARREASYAVHRQDHYQRLINTPAAVQRRRFDEELMLYQWLVDSYCSTQVRPRPKTIFLRNKAIR